MTVRASNKDLADEEWFREELEKLLSRAWRKDVEDAILVRVMVETAEAAEASAIAVVETLKELRGENDDDGTEDVAYG